MILDFEKHPITEQAFDLCIVGAGAAGIALARSLDDSNLSICILEAGGEIPTPESQDVYKGQNTGQSYYELDETRLRYLGGSSNHWEGLCIPMMEHDFDARPELSSYNDVEHRGWPIEFAEVRPYYEKAAEFFGTGDLDFGADLLQYIYDGGPILNEGSFSHRIWRQSPHTHRFLRLAHREWFEKHEKIQLYLNSTVTKIDLSVDKTQIKTVTVENLTGKKAIVNSRHFVLACGGIEIPRLMLANNQQAPHGLGNSSGLVGRYFTEHVEVYVGSILSAKNAMDPYITFSDEIQQTEDKIRLFPGFVMSPAEQKRLGVLNCNLAVQTMRDPESPITALKSLKYDINNGEWPDNAFTNTWRVLTGVGTLYDEWQARKGPQYNTDDMVTGLFARSEQAPNAKSIVSLDYKNKDAFGTPRVKVHWQLSPLDMKTLRVTTEAFGAELARQGLGRVRLLDWLAEEEWGIDTQGGHHHLGTTKMSISPLDGVVNTNLTSHDIDNLSIMSSSVFPTGGYANPTFTIAALAFRLGDHLRSQIAVSKDA